MGGNICHSVLTERAATVGERASDGFLGRERHLAEIRNAFASTRKGRAAVVRIAGRSVAGKSMLAQHVLDELSQNGAAVVLSGKCYERESVPYKALDSLIDALSRCRNRHAGCSR